VKSGLEHLPKAKQDELQDIVELIKEAVKPEMIILFGSYSRGNWVEDRYRENNITYEYKSDYDILIVTEKFQDISMRIGKSLRRRIRRADNIATDPQVIFHDIDFLNKELETGHYFFVDIIKEGTMLFNTGKFELAKPKVLTGPERAEIAKVYFREWFESANRFYIAYEDMLKREFYNIAIFQLHQSAERYYVTVELVFTHYKPKTHDLEILNKNAYHNDARFKTVFPNQTNEEKRLFNLLQKAYIDSRYKDGYSVNPDDLKWLAEKVMKLKDLVEKICKEKIEEFVLSN
jgi:HEPN domain-containing protein/predicted nucleotidyltransferase